MYAAPDLSSHLAAAVTLLQQLTQKHLSVDAES